MLLVLLIVLLLILFLGRGPIFSGGFSPLHVVLLILLILLIVSLVGGLGPYSRWPFYP